MKLQMAATLEELFTTYNAEIIATADEIAAWNPIDPVVEAARRTHVWSPWSRWR